MSEPESVSFVYFVQAGKDGPIKIGRTSDPKTRLRELQVGNHEELTLLCYIPEAWYSEADLHDDFAPFRIRGEWFRPDRMILNFINSLEGVTVATIEKTTSAWTDDSRTQAVARQFVHTVDRNGRVLDSRIFETRGRDILEVFNQ